MGWSKSAKAYRISIRNGFEADLQSVSESIASHEKAAQVSEAHVDQAFQALSRSGLERRRIADRPEAWTSVGSFFIGLAFACPDAISWLFPKNFQEGAIAGVFVASLVIGTVLLGVGLHLAKLPTPPPNRKSVQFWVRWFVVWGAIMSSLFAGGYFAYQRTTGCCVPASEPGETLEPTAADPEEFNTAPN